MAETLPPVESVMDSGRQRHPVFVQSESAKHTSVHWCVLVSQRTLWQSPSCWHVPPSGVLPGVGGPAKHAATAVPVGAACGTTYVHASPAAVHSALLRQALEQPTPSHSSLWQSLLKLQFCPLPRDPPCPQLAT
jgi:hypothetical protein